MRHNPQHASDDPEVVRRLIRDNPWAILVSRTDDDIVASHYPILLDEDADGIVVLTHVGRPDEELHGFGDREILIIVQSHNGYVSPSWYAPGSSQAPTWNFSTAHCYGVPEILDPDENLRVLTRLVEHFERNVEKPMYLDPEWARPVARGTVGLRIPIGRFICKVKMSQDKDEVSQDQVMAALRSPGPYANPDLADDMAAALGRSDTDRQ